MKKLRYSVQGQVTFLDVFRNSHDCLLRGNGFALRPKYIMCGCHQLGVVEAGGSEELDSRGDTRSVLAQMVGAPVRG